MVLMWKVEQPKRKTPLFCYLVVQLRNFFLKSQADTEKVVAAARNGKNNFTYNYRDSKTHLDLKSGISEGGTDDAKSYTN